MAMKDFILRAPESLIEPGEMLEAVDVPVMSPSARWACVKRPANSHSRRASSANSPGILIGRLSGHTTFFATETTFESDRSAIAGAFSPA
jgi:hypothetical protein